MKRSLVGLAAVMLVTLTLTLTLTGSAYAKDKEEKDIRSLTIQGQGKVSAVPDVAVLSIEVSHDGSELDPILSEVRQKVNKVLEAVKGHSIAEKDIRTELFQVRPKYESDKRGNAKKVGFVVTNRVSVKVRDLKKTGKILSAVVSAGASTVNGPDFEIDNPQEVERQALSAATKDARIKAQSVAEAAGVQLGEILTINPQSVGWPTPRRGYGGVRTMAMDAVAPEEPIAAGEQTLTGYVTITFAIQ